MKKMFRLFSLLMAISILISACGGSAKTETSTGAPPSGKVVEYGLLTNMVDGQMAFFGVGGGIDGVKNPMLSANVGDTVKVTLTSGDGVEHDVSFPDFNAYSEHISGKGSSTTLEFVPDRPGKFTYNCVVAGHKEAGMLGMFEVTGTALNDASSASAPASNSVTTSGPVVVNNAATTGADIVRDPTEIPATIPVREPQTVRIDLETVEIEGQLADGTTYKYWTFNGKVPGPFYRVRVGDTIEYIATGFPVAAMPSYTQYDGTLCRLPCRDRSRRRRYHDPDCPWRRNNVHRQGTESRSVCIPLCHPDGRSTHRQRHVRVDPRGT